MAPATLTEVGWSDARCWCGRVPERVRLTTSPSADEARGDLTLLGRCAEHAEPPGVDDRAVAVVNPSGSGSAPAVQWRDLHTALLVLGTVATALSEPLVMTEASGRCVFSNAAWSALTGLSPVRSRGLGWTAALNDRDRDRLHQQLTSSRPELNVRLQLRSPGRRGFRPAVHLTARPVTDFDGVVLGHLLSFDAQSAPESGAHLPEGAEGFDATTRLPDRQQFIDAIRGTLGTWQDRPTTFAVVVIDLDYSSEPGGSPYAPDVLLRALAVRLDGSIRPGDVLARSARDQFAVLSAEITSFNEVIGMAERLLTATNDVLHDPDRTDWSSASVGVAFPHLPGETAERLLAKAESAAALARSNGGEQVEVIIGTGPGSSDAVSTPSFPGFDIDLTDEAGAPEGDGRSLVERSGTPQGCFRAASGPSATLSGTPRGEMEVEWR